MNNDIDLFGTEYGPYGFYCTDFKYYDHKGGNEEPVLIKDAWDHEYYAHGTSYDSVEQWREDAIEAADDEEFVDEAYLDALLEYETIVRDILYHTPLITGGMNMAESKKVKKNLKKESMSSRSLQNIISPDWEIDFSAEGGCWWVANEKLGVVEEFDTYSDAARFVIEFEDME